MRSDSDGHKQSVVGELISAGMPPVPKRRRFLLTSARGVRRELASLYAQLRNHDIDFDEARTGAFVLRCLLESLRIDEIEQRLTALEDRTNGKLRGPA